MYNYVKWIVKLRGILIRWWNFGKIDKRLRVIVGRDVEKIPKVKSCLNLQFRGSGEWFMYEWLNRGTMMGCLPSCLLSSCMCLIYVSKKVWAKSLRRSMIIFSFLIMMWYIIVIVEFWFIFDQINECVYELVSLIRWSCVGINSCVLWWEYMKLYNL